MENDSSPTGHLKCGSCQFFIPGKFQACIHCKTCDQYFHENCFQAETEIDEVNEEDFEEDPLVPLESYDEVYVGETSREHAEKLLIGKKSGTFLIRFSKKEKQYVLTSISRKSDEQGLKCEHSKIYYKEVGGHEYYSLRAGYGRSTLLAAVEINRK